MKVKIENDGPCTLVLDTELEEMEKEIKILKDK